MADKHATLYDFRDLDIMFKIAESVNGAKGVASQDLADLMGFDEDARPLGIRLAWMKRYGMVAYDDKDHLWKLSRGGERVTEAQLKARTVSALDDVPDEAMVEVMAHVTSRYHHGQGMLGHMLRREFLFGTQKRKR